MTLFTDTVALFIDKELDIINVINIFAAGGIDLQKFIARSVVAENLATAAQIDAAVVYVAQIEVRFDHAVQRALARLTGEDATEATIDEVFSTFCVGK